MIAASVCYLGQRVDRLYVAELGALRRWPFHGIAGAIAWRFDGQRLTLVHIPSPSSSTDYRPRTLVPRSTKKSVSSRSLR